jgi:hypothetical protein
MHRVGVIQGVRKENFNLHFYYISFKHNTILHLTLRQQ